MERSAEKDSHKLHCIYLAILIEGKKKKKVDIKTSNSNHGVANNISMNLDHQVFLHNVKWLISKAANLLLQ